MATFKSNTAQILEIKASELNRDILDILEGISSDGLIEIDVLIETLNGPDDDYEDAYEEEWTAFVKELDTLNAISPFKYVMIQGA